MGSSNFFTVAIVMVALLFLAVPACRSEVRSAPSQAPVEMPDLGSEPAQIDDGSNGRWNYLFTQQPRNQSIGGWDGRNLGPHITWSEDGIKLEEGALESGRKVGPWTYRYPTGRKRWEGTYGDGRPEGRERAWYENGRLFYEGTNAGGKREGKFTYWHENGNKWYEGPYREGKKRGYFRYWYEDGVLNADLTGRYFEDTKVD